MAKLKEFRPIAWDESTGTDWFTTAYSGNMSKAGTAMFYGRSFASAGWLAVFKNTEKNTVKITTVKGYIGSRQDNVQAKVMCKPLGQTYTKDLASIKVESKYTTNISGNIPKRDKISTITSVVLKNPIEVKAGDYFCIGFLGTSIPSGHYFNMASRCLTKTVKNIFYTQDSNTDKTVTWYRSGNANDNTNWKKQYAYIWAEGQVEEAEAETSAVVTNPSPEPSETKITLSVSTNSIKIPQGSKGTVDISVGFVVKDDKNNKLKAPTWDFTYTNSDKFTVTCNGNTLDIKSTKYDNKALTTEITVTAISRNVSGRTKTVKITVNASAPTIDTLTVSKYILRPTETSQISCTYSANAGGVSYSIGDTEYAKLSGSIITAESRTDADTDTKKVVLTATTKNGGVKRSIELNCEHWSLDVLQMALSSTTMFTDTLFADSSDRISIINESLYGLKVNYSLKANTVLSFSNTIDLNKQDSVESKATTLLYSYGNEKQNVTDTLTACLSCDTTVTKSFTITLKAPPTAELNYPVGLASEGTSSISLPAIARKNVDNSSWNVYYSTYPIQITINNDNRRPIKVTISSNTGPTMKLGSAFDGTILSGTHWIRPECIPETYTNSLPKTKTITYTLAASYQELSGNYTKLFDKQYTITYKIYDELSDLISKNDQGCKMSAEKAETTLALARDILSQYIIVDIPQIKKDNYILNSKSSLSTALLGLSNLINTINCNSASLVTMPQHRTAIADGNYIMADDSVSILADGQDNPVKDYYLDLEKPTASPFRELVKAVYNLTGPIEHYKIVYKENNKTYTISKVEDTSTGILYLIDTLYL